jgi:betaine-aldehyde dehydrogenase
LTLRVGPRLYFEFRLLTNIGYQMHAHEIPANILPTQTGLYYGGAWHAPKAGVYADTINPTYNESITQAPVADATDVDAAVQAAHKAFPAWAATPPVERGR